MKATVVYDVKPELLIKELALKLKTMPEFKQPEWSFFVKTSSGKERPPEEKDFWFKRAASILRKIYVKGFIGVNRLRKEYGCRKNRGHRPEHFRKGSGKIIRVILQQATKAGLVEKEKKGRKLTKKGKEMIEKLAERIKSK